MKGEHNVQTHQCPECKEPWSCMPQRLGAMCRHCEPWSSRVNYCPACNWYWRQGIRNPKTGVQNNGGGYSIVRDGRWIHY